MLRRTVFALSTLALAGALQAAPSVGQPAPDFTLNDQDGKPFTFSSLRGSRVVLVFYRGYW